MAQKPNLLLSVAATVAVTAILAAFAAWVVCRFHPRPFLSAFWPCLAGALFTTFWLEGFNILEMAVIGGVVLLLAVVSIPFAARTPFPAFPAHVIASVASGMLSSRVFRRMHWRQW
ncbi:hypothetical protein [Roseimicrobium sp. ORNL1]|uniref:hypothetical protein n=1 Tax=Roseimicrobium sp. ORNL1 TaxID=2711231 RepID=UPI0013E1ADDF|nr:hypothetical protein [Roseimicrobium sp. ORNL1]QIF01796.1 hypothetical protein G5S37_09745 [Roseimicrobium sp. ORNL1]